MSFLESTILLPIRLNNPFLDTMFPSVGSVDAVLDTGYSGFVLVPQEIFLQLGFDQLVHKRSRAVLADGRRIELRGSYGSIVFKESLTVDGLVETNRDITEVLLGVDGIRKLVLTIDSCRRKIIIETCA